MRVIEKINQILKSDYSGYEIGKASGISASRISELRRGDRKVTSLTLTTVDKLEKFYDENF